MTIATGSDETRIWIFGSSRPLDGQNPILQERLNTFFSQWQSHGEPVSGKWRILDDAFLVVLREPDGAQVSGCSIDSMVNQIKQLESELGLSLLDSSRIFYRRDGAIVSASRAEFKELAAAGVITPDTEVCDTTVSRLSDLKPGGFYKGVKDSWHQRLYDQAVRAR